MACFQPRRIFGEVAHNAGVDRVSCGGCKSCVARRKRDLVGALLAESRTASTTWFVTVTFKDDAKASVFDYSEIQLLLKRVRETYADQGITLRFFAAGELGSLKGRCHWHLLLFFQGGVPVKPWINPGELWALWPHGWSRIEDLRHNVVGRARYCVMYALKEVDAEGFNVFRGSNATPLGTEYFRQLADRTARAGLAPDGAYTFSESRFDRGRHSGEIVQHRFRGVARDNFVRDYAAAWVKYRPNEPIPSTEWLEMVWPDDGHESQAREYQDLVSRCQRAKLRLVALEPLEDLSNAPLPGDYMLWQSFRKGGKLLIFGYNKLTRIVWAHAGGEGGGEIWRDDVEKTVYELANHDRWAGFETQDYLTRRLLTPQRWLVSVL